MIATRYYVGTVDRDTEFADTGFRWVTIEYRGIPEQMQEGDELWAVCDQGKCVSRSLCVSYERQNSSRTDAWKRTYRMTLAEAEVVAGKYLRAAQREWDAMIAKRKKLFGDVEPC